MNNRERVSCIIPAYNEENYISCTLTALRHLPEIDQLIVVDDGSRDRTAELARKWADDVIVHEKNRGKGAALLSGLRIANGSIILFIDGDLGLSAKNAAMLLPPLMERDVEMSVAVLPSPSKKGGMGLVKKLASGGIHRLTGYKPRAPLSGQRGLTWKAAESITSWDCGFGIEVGMTIDVLRAGYRIEEVEIPFSHRETGRDIQGFLHRGKQFWSVGQILQGKWKRYDRRVLNQHE